ERVETGMIGAEILDALDDARARIDKAGLAIDHLLARLLGLRRELIGPARERLDLVRIDEVGCQQPAPLAIVRHPLSGERRQACCRRAALAVRDVKHAPPPSAVAGCPVWLARRRLRNRSRSRAGR